MTIYRISTGKKGKNRYISNWKILDVLPPSAVVVTAGLYSLPTDANYIYILDMDYQPIPEDTNNLYVVYRNLLIKKLIYENYL
jgi:hypothetical protein